MKRKLSKDFHRLQLL